MAHSSATGTALYTGEIPQVRAAFSNTKGHKIDGLENGENESALCAVT
jgi:hypothetical protein